MPELTIITVVKDNLPGLKITYASLKEQLNQNFSWIVVDGASTDGTFEWLATIGHPLFKYSSRKDKSLFEAMNKGVAQLETEYCLFLNGGDAFWNAQVTEKICQAIQENHFLLGYGKYVLGSVPGFPQRERGRHIRTRTDMFHGPVPCHQSMIISRRAFHENGLYREDVSIYGDVEWIIRYSKKKHPSTFKYLPFVISLYHPKGLSYHRFFKYRRTYFKILWEKGNLFEFTSGLLGWTRAAVYIVVSKGLEWLRENDANPTIS